MTKCKQKPERNEPSDFYYWEWEGKPLTEWVGKTSATSKWTLTSLSRSNSGLMLVFAWWRWQQPFQWYRQQTQSKPFIEIKTHIHKQPGKREKDTNRNKLMLSSRALVSHWCIVVGIILLAFNRNKNQKHRNTNDSREKCWNFWVQP